MSRTIARFLFFLSLALATGVTPVLATVHLMVIQEVVPGTPADPEAQYVMLRMTSAGQRFTFNTYLRLEDEDGNLLGRFGTFTAPVANGGALCSWPSCPAILIGTQAADDLFSFSFDQVVDNQTNGGASRVPLPLGGGRVCSVAFSGTVVYDCVAWGNFDCRRSGNCSGANNERTGDLSGNGCDLTFSVRAPALQPGFTLARTQFNCAVKHNANDFDLLFPRPVNNIGSSNNVDSDGDGLINVLDCASADNTSLYLPTLVTGTSLQSSSGLISWDAQDKLAGSSTLYDIVKGDLSDLRTDADFLLAFCLASGLAGNSFVDSTPNPLLKDGDYRFLRARNNCRAGSYGNSTLIPDPRDFLDSAAGDPCL